MILLLWLRLFIFTLIGTVGTIFKDNLVGSHIDFIAEDGLSSRKSLDVFKFTDLILLLKLITWWILS